MKFYNKTLFKWVQIIIGIIFAIIVAVIGKLYESNNFLSDVFIGFIFPYIVLIPFQISGKSVEKTHDLEESLQKLYNTNKNTYELYFAEVEELTVNINKCCDTLIYKCSYKPNMELYKSVCGRLMAYFNGDTEHDYFFATANCSRDDINWFFDKYNLAGEFLPLINEKCQAKKITEFKRLFIYKEEDFKNPVFLFLIRLHQNLKNNSNISYCKFDFKFINANAFKNIILEDHISYEMGIWGSHCVFVNDTNLNGYSFDTNQIAKYKRVFDDLWDNPNSKTYQGLTTIKLDKLTCNDDFEKTIYNILINIENNSDTSSITDVKDKDLSILDIAAIQNWVQGIYPRSTSIGHISST